MKAPKFWKFRVLDEEYRVCVMCIVLVVGFLAEK